MRFRLKSGLALGYKTRGAGPIVALVPPIGCPKEFWDPVISVLQDRCRLIAIDVRGHGESDVPSSPFTLDDCAGDLIELLRSLGDGRKTIVAGCSMGAMVAMGAAVHAPDLICGLLASNTHQRDATGQAIIAARAEACRNGMASTVEATLDRWFNAPYQQAHPEHVALARGWLANADPIVHSWSWRAIHGLDYAARLRPLSIPKLVVGGEADQSSSVAEVRHFANVIGAGFRQIASAGHLTPLEQPKAYAACLCEMLDGLESQGLQKHA